MGGSLGGSLGGRMNPSYGQVAEGRDWDRT